MMKTLVLLGSLLALVATARAETCIVKGKPHEAVTCFAWILSDGTSGCVNPPANAGTCMTECPAIRDKRQVCSATPMVVPGGVGCLLLCIPHAP